MSNKSIFHPNENRIIFYPNTEHYAAYGFKDKGGVLTDGLCEAMNDDAIIDMDLLDLQDAVRDNVENKLVPVIDDNGKIIGEYSVRVEIKTTMRNRLMKRIYSAMSNKQKKTMKIGSLNVIIIAHSNIFYE